MRHDIITVAVVSAVTIAVRFLPFIVFRDSSNVPESVTYL